MPQRIGVEWEDMVENIGHERPIHILKAMLQVSVPMHALLLKDVPWNELLQKAKEAAQYIAEHGDALMFPTKGVTAMAFNHLAKGLAILSMMPGGVDFMGMHFETPPPSESTKPADDSTGLQPQ
jgi:hypothetical protein